MANAELTVGFEDRTSLVPKRQTVVLFSVAQMRRERKWASFVEGLA
jgi:hypothetical protein